MLVLPLTFTARFRCVESNPLHSISQTIFEIVATSGYKWDMPTWESVVAPSRKWHFPLPRALRRNFWAPSFSILIIAFYLLLFPVDETQSICLTRDLFASLIWLGRTSDRMGQENVLLPCERNAVGRSFGTSKCSRKGSKSPFFCLSSSNLPIAMEYHPLKWFLSVPLSYL